MIMRIIRCEYLPWMRRRWPCWNICPGLRLLIFPDGCDDSTTQENLEILEKNAKNEHAIVTNQSMLRAYKKSLIRCTYQSLGMNFINLAWILLLICQCYNMRVLVFNCKLRQKKRDCYQLNAIQSLHANIKDYLRIFVIRCRIYQKVANFSHKIRLSVHWLRWSLILMPISLFRLLVRSRKLSNSVNRKKFRNLR